MSALQRRLKSRKTGQQGELNAGQRDYEKMIRRLSPQELEQLNQELERDINRKYDDEW